MRFGLRSKLVLAFAIPTVIIAGLLLALQQYLVGRAMRSQTVEQGQAIARTIESTAGYYVIFGLTDDLKNIVNDLGTSPSVEYAEFLDGNQKVLAASRSAQPAALVNHALQRERGATVGDDLHVYTVPFYETKADASNPAAKPKGWFRLLLNESQAEGALTSLRGWNTGIAALVLVVASLLAWFASRLLVRPILALVDTARLIAKGDLTQRASVTSGDEIGSLAEAFNG
ncbi:MAG: HAMP domain-containing protein, partial [Thermoanaerobaculia bacterium]